MSGRYLIPLEALDDRLGIVGTSGSGKTYGAGTAVEKLLHRKSRVINFDPLDVWWGLRLQPDGKGQGFPVVIFGGAHADLPINAHAGALIGETIAKTSESCIVSTALLGRKADERRFMLACLDALYKHATGEPVHLIFDEADMWAPQKLLDKDGDATKLQSQMEMIVRRGRVKGFIPWLITQRPAVLSKDVLSQVDGLIAMKLTSSQDRKALGAWIEGQADVDVGKRIQSELPAKQRGEAVVWIPARSVLTEGTFPEKATYDSSSTPKRGERKKRAAVLKPLDIASLKEKLSSVEAEAKANDPKALRAELAALRVERDKLARQMETAVARKSSADPKEIEAAEQRGFNAGYAQGCEDEFKRGESVIRAQLVAVGQDATGAAVAVKAIAGGLAALVQTLDQLAKRKIKVPASPPAKIAQTAPTIANANGAAPAPRPAKPIAAVSADGAQLTGPQTQLLAALSWWAHMGHDTPTRTQIAAIAGWTPRGSNLRGRLSELSTAGLIEYPQSGLVRLTPAGRAVAPPPDTSRTLIDSIRAVLTGPQAQIFETLLQGAGAGMIAREDLANAIGWEPGGSNLRGRLSELSALELVEYPQKGHVALQSWVTA